MTVPATRLVARFRELAPFLGMSKGVLALLVVASMLAGVAEACVLVLIAYAATALSSSADAISLRLNGLDLGRVGVSTVLIIAFALVVGRLAVQEVGVVIPARLGADLQQRLRRELWAAYLGASWEQQAEARQGSLQDVLTGHVLQATQAVLMAANGLAAAVTFVVLVLAALALNIVVAGLTMVAAVVLFLGLRPLTRIARRHSARLARANVDYAEGISEGVRMAEELHTFGVGDAEQDRSLALAGHVRHAYFRTQVLRGQIIPLYQGAALLLIIGGLAGLYVSGNARVAALGAVVLILIRALNYSQTVQGAYHNVNESLPFVDIVRSIRDGYEQAAAPDGSATLTAVTSLEFSDVSFAYVPGREVLHGISFRSAAGASIGVVGPSGAGKSTLVALLLGLRTATAGSVLANDVPVDALARADWFRHVAFVPQEARLLNGSVRENIRFLRPWIDDAAVEAAARQARIDDEIGAFAHGYDTVIGPRSDAVSGGQRQRLCLARALAGRPDVLLLDEPTSALDMRSEALVQESLQDLRGDVTMFVVAHRLSMLKVCDLVMVLADGRIEAFGPTDDVVGNNPFLRDALSLSQATGTGTRP